MASALNAESWSRQRRSAVHRARGGLKGRRSCTRRPRPWPVLPVRWGRQGAGEAHLSHSVLAGVRPAAQVPPEGVRLDQVARSGQIEPLGYSGNNDARLLGVSSKGTVRCIFDGGWLEHAGIGMRIGVAASSPRAVTGSSTR